MKAKKKISVRSKAPPAGMPYLLFKPRRATQTLRRRNMCNVFRQSLPFGLSHSVPAALCRISADMHLSFPVVFPTAVPGGITSLSFAVTVLYRPNVCKSYRKGYHSANCCEQTENNGKQAVNKKSPPGGRAFAGGR